ncbi:hypothetical protein AcW1_007472 [Taiwanofungus camphoratus]|nr:hypothetical protein AcW2_007472 [Antrodia cinnamomea]KAI0927217.1 hypothetical protein AcV5_007809 [Antrodia cinnamomea]KAI0953183.1 hypothetical protein AcW1_007472 [Antrodia cinnamomea]
MVLGIRPTCQYGLASKNFLIIWRPILTLFTSKECHGLNAHRFPRAIQVHHAFYISVIPRRPLDVSRWQVKVARCVRR